jgi:hypothetical protein
MLAILIILAIVGGIAFFLVFTQGLFSALIMCVLCLISALIAFNYYEALGSKLNDLGLAFYGGEAISLMVLFLLSLLVMRLAFDRLIKGNMKFPLLVDRIGSAFFGLIAGLVIAGIIALGFQLLPTPAKILGFDRFPEIADRSFKERNNLFPSADGFVSSVVCQASKYGFAGAETYSQYHPDFLAEVYLNRLTLDPYSRQSAAADSVKVDKAWLVQQDNLLDCRRNEQISPERGEIFIAVRLHINAGSGSKDDSGAADADGIIRFTLGNIRLSGFEEEDKYAKGLSRYPLGILKPGFQVVDGMGYDKGREFEKDQSRAVDLLFSWPENYKKIKPLFVELKGSARATMPSVSKLEEEKAPEMKQWFDASRNVTQADFEAHAENNLSYTCKSLSIITKDQKDFNLPRIPLDDKVKEDQNYKEMAPMILQNNRYAQTHFRIRSRVRALEAKTYDLFVPQGFHLFYLRIDGQRKPLDKSFVLPTLLDTQTNEIYPAGIKAEGSSNTELAYSLHAAGATNADQAYPKSKDILMAQNKDYLNEFLVFYLVPSQTANMGIIGCRTRSGSTADPGQIWNFKDNVDIIRAP